MLKTFGVVAFGILAASVMAAKPTFTWTKTVDYSPHCCLGNPMAALPGPNDQGIYFGDWYAAGVFYVNDPLASDGSEYDTAVNQVVNNNEVTWETNCSYQGIARDGNIIYTGGQSVSSESTGTVLLAITEESPSTWTYQQVTLGNGGAYSGPTVVAPGKLAMANWETGGIQFFDVSGSTATPDGAEIPNPNIGQGKVTTVAYDAVGHRLFVYIVEDYLTRRIDLYNSNGTPAGTTYVGTYAPGITSTLEISKVNPEGADKRRELKRSGTLTVNQKYGILIASNRNETDNGFDLFDISGNAVTGTPYKEIRSADLNNTIPVNDYDVTGSAIFTENGNDYLALFTKNLMAISLVTDSGVTDYTLY